ncbi:orexin receptor type 2-like [Octopus sinensis]|uniref:Orexin receptor type 2-like n=1 Tax=Octopus sinensis TaxID=2607531 RepID=A0A6P7T5P2_9MOLL|nr:orexin receptor type 2-like [Octopus sinensis]
MPYPESTRDISENQNPVFKHSANFKKMDKNYTVIKCSSLQEVNDETVKVHFPAIVLLVFEMVLGAIGNCIAAYIYHYKFEVSSTQIFIVALSMYDFLASTICIPMEIVLLHRLYTFEYDTTCRLIRSFVALTIISSALIVIIISIDRYILICRPLNQKISIKNSKRIIAVLASLSFLFCIPVSFVYRKHYREVKQCGRIGTVCSLSEKSIFPLIYYTTVLVFCALSFIILMVIYLLIGIRIWKIYRAKQLKNAICNSVANENSVKSIEDTRWPSLKHLTSVKLFTSGTSGMRIRKHSMHPFRTTLLLFVLTLIWTMSYVPHFIGTFRRMFTKNFNDSTTHKQQLTYHLLTYSYYIICAANPYIYGLFCQHFRSELMFILRKMFVCCKK